VNADSWGKPRRGSRRADVLVGGGIVDPIAHLFEEVKFGLVTVRKGEDVQIEFACGLRLRIRVEII
jgi:hypothetical protein